MLTARHLRRKRAETDQGAAERNCLWHASGSLDKMFGFITKPLMKEQTVSALMSSTETEAPLSPDQVHRHRLTAYYS